MTEAPKQHPALRYIYEVVQRRDPTAAQALGQAELFFRTLSKDAKLPKDQRPQREVPEVFDTTEIFQTPLKELRHEYVLQRLRSAVQEAVVAEARGVKRKRKATKRAENIPMIENLLVEVLEEKEQENGVEGEPTRLDPEVEVDVFAAQLLRDVDRYELKKTSKPRKKFTPPSGYLVHEDIIAMFPDFTNVELKEIKAAASKINHGPRGTYYTIEDMVARAEVIKIRKQETTQKRDEQRAGRKQYPRRETNKLLAEGGKKVIPPKWTNAAIENEAAQIYRTHGKLTTALLTNVPGLRRAVARHYPEQVTGLQKRMQELDNRE